MNLTFTEGRHVSVSHCRKINKLNFNFEYPYPQNSPLLWIFLVWISYSSAALSHLSLPGISLCLPTTPASSKAVSTQKKFISLSYEDSFTQSFLQTISSCPHDAWPSTECLHIKHCSSNVFPGWIYLFLIIIFEEGSITIPILQVRGLRNRDAEWLAQHLELEILLNKKPASPLVEFVPIVFKNYIPYTAQGLNADQLASAFATPIPPLCRYFGGEKQLNSVMRTL